jgi:hypothetical protein
MYHHRPLLIWNKGGPDVFAYRGQGSPIPPPVELWRTGPGGFVPKVATGAATSNKSPGQTGTGAKSVLI